MTTANQLLRSAQARRDAADQRRRAAAVGLAEIVDRAERQNRSYLSPAEDAAADRLLGDRDTARRELRDADSEIANLRAVIAEDQVWLTRTREVHPTGIRRPGADRTASLSVTRNERTYRPDLDPNGRGFLLDVTRNFLFGDPEAQERLVRHMAEERAERPGFAERAAGDTNTGNWAGLVVPQYLVDYTADQIRALRPFADLCCVPVPLPAQGMSINFSKVTTGSSVALQANEFDGVSATSLDDTLGTANVQTAAGQQTVSRQAVERGAGIEDTTIRDLTRKHAVAIDSTLITQASTGLSAVGQTVTYTSASPTGAEFYPYIYQAASKLEAALLGVAYPSHVVMHSRRWNWLASQVGTSWPLVNSAGVPPQSTAFALTTEYGPQVRAVLNSGLKVVVDNNVPTTTGGNQDEVYVVAAGESMYLAEDPNAPMLIRAEQPKAANLGVLLVLYSYFAYFTRYANPASKIVGTGTAPANF